MTLLEQLKQHSIIVADTGDLDAIRQYSPEDATTNPSLIFKAATSGQYDAMIKATLESVSREDAPLERRVDDAADRLIVAMGRAIVDAIPGRVSTEVDARLSFDTDASINKARKLAALYREAGVSGERFLIKLAATWEGICAARVLEAEGIHCNLTLIFNEVQARACAEAGVYLISPFVGRILDWHRKADPDKQYSPETEPGVESVRAIYQYFRERDYPTIVMGASFRNTGEILALAGCDRLTISPALLETLACEQGKVTASLSPAYARQPRPPALSEAEFRLSMNRDAMATEKLAEGIRGFETDQIQLAQFIREKLRQR
ncbi:MAG: transaldolase [Saccharospirillum sp.]